MEYEVSIAVNDVHLPDEDTPETSEDRVHRAMPDKDARNYRHVVAVP